MGDGEATTGLELLRHLSNHSWSMQPARLGPFNTGQERNGAFSMKLLLLSGWLLRRLA